MAIAVEISLRDMDEFLSRQGFSVISNLPHTREVVYGKVVGANLCLRVYTSIEGESSRGVGEDAIRTVLVARVEGEVKLIGSDRRVHRVELGRLPCEITPVSAWSVLRLYLPGRPALRPLKE